MWNGTSLEIGDRRIVAIPSEAIGYQEFTVPQEWIDIPKFVADYYLAVQVIPDELSIYIWGVTTHSELKTKGEYESFDRNYILDRCELIEDVDSFLVSLEICPQQRAEIQPLPKISQREVDRAIQTLSEPCPYLPRIELNFSLWGAILENDESRQRLYQRRHQLVKQLSRSKPFAEVKEKVSKLWQSITTTEDRSIHLLGWLDEIVEPGWLSPQELSIVPVLRGDSDVPKSSLETNAEIQELSIVPVFRGDSDVPKSSLETNAEIQDLIDRIENSSADEADRQIAAQRLGELKMPTTAIINCLANLIRTTTTAETLWTAAESLSKLDPDSKLHLKLTFSKAIDLGMQLAGHRLALLIGFCPQSDDKVAILARVFAMERHCFLPLGCQMTLLDERGNVFDEIVAERPTPGIQQMFSGSRGDRFSIKVSLENSCIGKDFLIDYPSLT